MLRVLFAAGLLVVACGFGLLGCSALQPKGPTRADIIRQEAQAIMDERKAEAQYKAAQRPAVERRIARARAKGLVVFDAKGWRLGDAFREVLEGNCFNPHQTSPHYKCRDSTSLDGEWNGERLSIFYYFVDETLEAVSLIFPETAYSKIRDAYTAKFGTPPHRRRTEVVQTAIGGEYVNEIVEWDTDAGIFKLQRYGADVLGGDGDIRSEKSIAHRLRQRDIKARDLGNKL